MICTELDAAIKVPPVRFADPVAAPGQNWWRSIARREPAEASDWVPRGAVGIVTRR
jgi:hypothetical protein